MLLGGDGRHNLLMKGYGGYCGVAAMREVSVVISATVPQSFSRCGECDARNDNEFQLFRAENLAAFSGGEDAVCAR